MLRRLALCLVLLSLSAWTPGCGFAPDAAPPIALLGGRLIDGTGGTPVENSVVLIQDDRIVAAGPRDQVPVPPDASVFSIARQTVMPGLIESNGHVVFSGQSDHATYFAERWQEY